MSSTAGHASRATAKLPEQVLKSLKTPWEQFTQTETSSGIILILAALVAFAWANSPLSDSYFAMRDLEVGFTFGGFAMHYHLSHWVNDLLMALFFFVVGLEIKREFMVGELAGFSRASLPIAGALGGMVVPALIYTYFNVGLPSISGWGVPMATDIAFAVGVLALLGSRVPTALKVFLLALAIVDDLGAVLVIAIFYTSDLNLLALLLSFVAWGAALFYGMGGGVRPIVFLIVGAVCWYFMHESGVHATIAGVLMAIAVPLRHGMTADEFDHAVKGFERGHDFEDVEVEVQHLEHLLESARSPLHRMEHALQPYISYCIMPVFALFNAGVALGGGEATYITPVSIGAFFGLLLGKPIGIAGFAFIAVMTRLTVLPRGANWIGMLGVGLIAGIGFTMALFIAGLAFPDPHMLDEAKLGVLCASVVAAVLGLAFLTVALPKAGEAGGDEAGSPHGASAAAGVGARSEGGTS
ncbi:Na+/H+ antiporter NhaA [Marinivivus vitaminiproducens]|uniref:Na+/H+ antiporter NhaA n=1 Tax=Marinivivus vitaminiproducens TaxID=3035935 RepID=UPI00279E7034|nr:Na+/H+ antiporter NhaA [Geminicoccaceae bacterium SCSIO 64248]